MKFETLNAFFSKPEIVTLPGSHGQRLNCERKIMAEPVSSSVNRPTLRRDVERPPESWLVGNVVKELVSKKGSQLPTNGEALHNP